MTVEIDKDKCIGCGACTTIVPEVFELGDDGLAFVKTDEYNESKKDDIKDAAESCPTGAIIIKE
ncbi:MAG: ferredoxin [Bacilli bacterium]